MNPFENPRNESLNVVLFPLMAQGHMIPLFDVARLIASRGVRATLVTTLANAAAFPSSSSVEMVTVPFPSEAVGLRPGVENVSQLAGPGDSAKFNEAMRLIAEGPLAELLEARRPGCLVSDVFMPCTADVAARARVPWVVFHGGGYFAQLVSEVLRLERPQWTVESEDEEFVVPGLSGKEVRLTRRRLSPVWAAREKSEFDRFIEAALEAAAEKSAGMVMNSFYELESDYVDRYEKTIGKKCWSLGPLSLYYRNTKDKATKGTQMNIDEQDCLRWLDSKPKDSVIYVCFGSIAHMPSSQLTEIAMSLEASNHHFIWVVRRQNDDMEEWLPSGFEARNQDKGLILRGWAPQVMILSHVATCGFITHCGWNSTLEAVSSGVPMVTWPIFAEQFLNEKLITNVLRIGVPVGADQSSDWMETKTLVKRPEIEAAIGRVMAGEEGIQMRRRVAELKELAWKAVRPGGSSYNDLTRLIQQLQAR